MLKQYELSLAQLKELKKFSKKIGINFLLSVFDVESLKKFNSDNFYKKEIDFRKYSNLPPFYKFISIVVSGKNSFHVQKYAVQLKQTLPKNEFIEIYGPVSAVISKIKSDFRFRLLIKYNPKVTPQAQIKKKLELAQLPKNLKLQVDVDPLNFV